MLYFQLFSALLCVASAMLNLKQAAKWNRKQRALRIACKVILHDGEMQLGIVGRLPPVGTFLYTMDEAPAEHTVKA